MKLELLMTCHADLREPTLLVGPGPAGIRAIAEVAGGTVEGPRIKGTVRPGGGDWFLLGNDGVGRLDVRTTIETDDGAYIYMQYHGVSPSPGPVTMALAGGPPTEYGNPSIITTPRFETGDERYLWLNSVVAVAEGRALPNVAEYRVYQVLHD